jgi:hypothetical protein
VRTASIGATWRLGAAVASFVGLTEVLFAWLLVDQRPTLTQALGGPGGAHQHRPRAGR